MAEKSTIVSYDKQLNRISEALVEMGVLVEQLVALASKAINDPKTNYVDQAKEIDAQVNQLDLEVERKATDVLTLRQPMAVDFRIVTASLKMCSYFESMGDLSKSVTKKALQPDISLPKEASEEFTELADVIVTMVRDVIDAFKKMDRVEAARVWKRDDEVDELYHDLYRRLQERMQEDPSHIPSYMRIMFAAKSFERIGDYATKLAKNVYYIATGERFDEDDTSHSTAHAV